MIVSLVIDNFAFFCLVSRKQHSALHRGQRRDGGDFRRILERKEIPLQDRSQPMPSHAIDDKRAAGKDFAGEKEGQVPGVDEGELYRIRWPFTIV